VTVASDRSAHFLALHHGDGPLLIPNPWDVGSAKLLASLGFQALATTSSGFAATLGRLDGTVTRDEAIAHGAQLAANVEVPVSADLEHGFGDSPDEVAETVRLAAATDLAGCSIEDSTGRSDAPIYDRTLAADRVAAAADAAHADGRGLVLTARAENHLHGAGDLADTIARLQAFEAAGADVLYAPGLHSLDDITAVVGSVGRPVNVLTWPGGPTVAELAAVGVRRISVGGALSYVAVAAVAEAARELLDAGTLGFLEQARAGRSAAHAAFT
jgi:2-methylisocitrate lyase-like PEP mutase family enzyme